MEVIVIDQPAFYELVQRVLAHFETKKDEGRKWISAAEAMSKLGIKSKTTLQKFRDMGFIRYSQIEKKIILYDSESIDEFLNQNARERF